MFLLKILYLLATVYYFSNINFLNALPLDSKLINKGQAFRNIKVPSPEILKFMRRFGYLEPNPRDSEALYHKSAIVEAVKNIQKFGAINQTGELDDNTLQLFSTPRCGVPDLSIPALKDFTNEAITSNYSTYRMRKRNKRFVVGAQTWTKHQLKYLIANRSLKISTFQIERDIERAFSIWSRYSGLQFERVNNSEADIIVGFGSFYHGDNFPFDGPGNILAHAYYPYEMGSWGGDIHFDDDENWKENSINLENGVDFFSVAIHEIGHSLGLGHSPIYSSIMFPYYKGPKHNALYSDDILAMYEMYLSKQFYVNHTTTPALDDGEVILSSTISTRSKSLITTTPDYCVGDCVTLDKYESKIFVRNTSDDYNNRQSEHLEIPDICLGYFDAVTVINGSVYIFKGKYVWKLTEKYTIANDYPRCLWDLFPFLPADVRSIDAAYERYDGATVLFIESVFWVFRGSEILENSPNKLMDLINTRNQLIKVDAVMKWPKNNRTYIFAGSIFWRYNDQLKILDAGYPKPMNRWPGIPSNLNAATTLNNGKTYFFKDDIYWLYNNKYLRPELNYPRRASVAWLGCSSRTTKSPLHNFNTNVPFISSLPSISPSISILS